MIVALVAILFQTVVSEHPSFKEYEGFDGLGRSLNAERRMLETQENDGVIPGPDYAEEPGMGWTSDLIESYQDNPILRQLHVIYIQRPYESEAVVKAHYEAKFEEIVDYMNFLMQFHEIPMRFTRGDLFMKDKSLYYETSPSCSESLAQCATWATELGKDPDSWEMWHCSLPSSYYPDCGGMAYAPGQTSFMGEYSWYGHPRGILHEIGHNLNAEHQSDLCFPNIENDVSDDNEWQTLEGGGDGCIWNDVEGKGSKSIIAFTDSQKQYCEGDRCVVLGNDETHDNASRMRKRFHNMLASRPPVCPAGDSREICIKHVFPGKATGYCTNHATLGYDIEDALECGKYIQDNPGKCPSQTFAFAYKSWGCRCCKEGDDVWVEHRTWKIFEVKLDGTLKPTSSPTERPSPDPLPIVPTMQPTDVDHSYEEFAKGFTCNHGGARPMGNTAEECARFIAENPAVCPSMYYMGLPWNYGWGCRCCKTVEPLTSHNIWRIYKVNLYTTTPEPTTTLMPTNEPTTTSMPTNQPVVILPVDNWGEECWTSFGCWGDKGTVCDGCGQHDGKDMLCCRSNWSNHPNCNGAVFNPYSSGHHCVYIDESIIQPENDNFGQECWSSFGCWGDKGTVCDGCGLHDGKEMLCCRPGWHNHPNCNDAIYQSSNPSHQCAYIEGTLEMQTFSFDLLDTYSASMITKALALVGVFAAFYHIFQKCTRKYTIISEEIHEEI